MNRAQRRIALAATGGFLTIVFLVLIANAESSIADLAAAGAHIPDRLVWSWEWTSVLGWLSVCPLLWRAVARIRPPRVGWPVVTLAVMTGSVIASGWHITVMIVLRHAYYAATGAGPYRFFGVIGNRLLYEYRKDLTTYLQFLAIAAAVQWILARAADSAASPSQQVLTVEDGAVRHRIPVSEIERISSAGNYVEIAWGPRTLLHRATLSGVEQELGNAFVRIHRGQLVRREAIRQVAVDRSGDFTVTMASGAEVKGSRRFREAIG